jgi:hypothetical protein
VTTALSAEDFGQLFQTFRTSAFRLETLPRYSVAGEAEELQLFLEGKPKPQREGVRPWLKMIARHVADGRRMQRVHLIRGELTDYLRWEIGWGYPENAAAGEDIRILQVGSEDLPELGNEDFWLFDDERVVLMRYGSNGQLLERVPTLVPEVLGACRRKRNLTLSLGVPLSTYLAGVNT